MQINLSVLRLWIVIEKLICLDSFVTLPESYRKLMNRSFPSTKIRLWWNCCNSLRSQMTEPVLKVNGRNWINFFLTEKAIPWYKIHKENVNWKGYLYFQFIFVSRVLETDVDSAIQRYENCSALLRLLASIQGIISGSSKAATAIFYD